MNNSFCSIVDKAFGFLQTDFGFAIRKRGRSAVICESRAVIASLSYDDQRSFEVSFGLKRKSDPPQPSFTFDEILRSLEVPVSIWPSGYSATSLPNAQQLIEKIATIMASYAKQLLEGENEAWKKIADQRQTDVKKYALENNLRAARTEVDVAWRSKDYACVVKAFEPLRAVLTAAEVGKLEFAQKEIRKKGTSPANK
jgi:hypothetical protein